MDTAAPVDALPFPVVAIADCSSVATSAPAALLAERVVPGMLAVFSPSGTTLLVIARLVLPADAAAEDKVGVAGGVAAADAVGTLVTGPAVTDPAVSCELADPLGLPPEVLIHI